MDSEGTCLYQGMSVKSTYWALVSKASPSIKNLIVFVRVGRIQALILHHR